MRELILLRHAHAVPAGAGQADLDRPLSPEGLAEAEAAGRWLEENGLVPDCVLCSPARRTRETLEAVLGVIGYIDQRLEPSIYDATAGALVALLHSGQSGDYRGMPPGGIAVLSMPAGVAIEPGIGTLAAFWWP